MSDTIKMKKRIIVADALRGFALMGLFIVHMVEYFELYWYNPEPGWIHNLIFFLFGGKAYGIFALLFGLSFYIILENYAHRGSDFRGRFIWRLTLLLLIGYLHSLLYAGDILQLLALCGLLLVITHQCTTKTIAAIAVLFLAQIPTAIQAILYNLPSLAEYQQPYFIALSGANFEVFANGSLLDVIQHNTFDGQLGKWAFFIETGRLWNIIGLMFAGVYLGRIGFFERVHSSTNILRGVVITITCLLLLIGLNSIQPETIGSKMTTWSAGRMIEYAVNLAYISLGIWLFIAAFQTRIGGKILSLWAATGRMTLSFYLLQSVIFVPLFYGFGLSWFSTIGQLNALLLGIGCWVLQLAAAHYYLKHFRYGPAEKFWRITTLYKFKPNNNAAG